MITLGGTTSNGIGFTPDGSLAYVARTAGLDVIDTALDEIDPVLTAALPALPPPSSFGNPNEPSITSDGCRLYSSIQANIFIYDFCDETTPDIDLVFISLGGGCCPDLALTPDEKRLYAGMSFSGDTGEVRVIDTDPSSPTFHTVVGTVTGIPSVNSIDIGPENQPPVSLCQNISVSADSNCLSPSFSIDARSFDPDGNPITLAQTPQPVAKGDTEVTLTVTDSHGAVASCAATVTVTDDSAPSTIVTNSLVEVVQDGPLTTVDVVSLSGFIAFDNCDPNLTIDVNPSGPYAPGDNTVTISSTDDDGNVQNDGVTVRVLTAQDVSQNTIDEVEDLVSTGSVNGGQGNSLTRKLEAAIAKLNQGNTNAGCNQLQAFINQVNDLVATGELSAQEGQTLIDLANDARSAAGC